MWTRLLFAKTLPHVALLLFIASTMYGGVLPFKCNGYSVREIKGSSGVAGCVDTLTIHLGFPIASKHPQSPVEWPVSLFKRVYTNSILDTVPVGLTVRFDLETGNMVVLTDGMSIYDGDSSAPTRYVLYIDCRYFTGPSNEEPQPQYFIKDDFIRAYSIARSMKDSSSLDHRLNSVPSRENCLTTVKERVMISTAFQDSKYTFDHWSCSIPDVNFNRKQVYQIIDQDCWPQSDTVYFTAWYRETAVGVEAESGENIPDFRCDIRNGSIVMEGANQFSCRLQLVDLQGRVVRGNSTEATSLLHEIDVRGLNGIYFLVGTVNAHPVARSFILHD